MPDRPICHVHYLDLVSDPVATVEQVYQHFGMQLGPAAAQAMSRYVAERPNGGYGRHRYRFEDHGLDPDAERVKFRPYMLHFGIEAEAARSARRGPARQKQAQRVLPPGGA